MAGSSGYCLMGHRFTLVPTIGDWCLLHMAWSPGLPGPPTHSQQASEFFYVLSGRLDLCLDGQWHYLGPGESLSVEKGVIVQMRNGADTELALLLGFSPRGFEDFIAEHGIPLDEPDAFNLSHSAETVSQLVAACSNYGMKIPELGMKLPATDPTEKPPSSSDDSDQFWLMGHRMRVLHTIGDFSLIEIVATPGVAGPPIHRDEASTEFFYVLEGKLDLMVDGEWWTLRPGESLCIPAGTEHSRGKTAEPGVTWLTGWSPRGFEQLVRDCGVPAGVPNAMEESLSEESIRRLVTRVAEFGMILPDLQEPRWPDERNDAPATNRRDSQRRPEPDERT